VTFVVETAELGDLERFTVEHRTSDQLDACASAIAIAQQLVLGGDSRLVRVRLLGAGVVVDPLTIVKLAKQLLKEADDANRIGNNTGVDPVRTIHRVSELLRSVRSTGRGRSST
jgi:hypothetical protein